MCEAREQERERERESERARERERESERARERERESDRARSSFDRYTVVAAQVLYSSVVRVCHLLERARREVATHTFAREVGQASQALLIEDSAYLNPKSILSESS